MSYGSRKKDDDDDDVEEEEKNEKRRRRVLFAKLSKQSTHKNIIKNRLVYIQRRRRV